MQQLDRVGVYSVDLPPAVIRFYTHLLPCKALHVVVPQNAALTAWQIHRTNQAEYELPEEKTERIRVDNAGG